jgi:hypothetical protein
MTALFFNLGRLPISGMAMESAGYGKFAKFVADHILRDKDGNEFFPVMHGKGQTYHLWQYRGSARPGFYDTAVII